MTKTWEEVREEICKLYGEGRSLEYIRKTLQRQRHFEASTRAFRLKLKAWKIKRSDTVAGQSNGHHPLPDFVPQPLPMPERVLHSDIDHSTVRPTDGRRAESSLGPEPGPRLQRSLEDLYLQMRGVGPADSGELADPFLGPDDFVDGSTSMLHFAVKEPASSENVKLIKRLLEYMQYHSTGVDIRDRKGRTALELAIRKDSFSLTELLLDHGASVNQHDSQGYTPLHMALIVGASPSMFHLLLGRGADANACLPMREKSRTPLQWLARTLRSIDNSTRSDYLKCFDVASSLLNYEAGWSHKDLEGILRSFVYYWAVSSGSHQLFDSAKVILRTYLDAGADPMAMKCDEAHQILGCDVTSLAHLAVVHSPNATLGCLLVKRCKSVVQVRSLISHVLRHLSCGACQAPPAVLETILRLAFARCHPADLGEDYRGYAEYLITALKHADDGQVVDVVQAIVHAKPQALRIDRFTECRELVHALTERRKNARFALAEIVLVDERSPEDVDSLPEMMRDARRLASQRDFARNIDKKVREFLFQSQCPEIDKQIFICCVVHVVTKEVIQNLSHQDPRAKEILIEIIRTRHQNGLPDLAIPQHLLRAAFCNDTAGGGLDTMGFFLM